MQTIIIVLGVVVFCFVPTALFAPLPLTPAEEKKLVANLKSEDWHKKRQAVSDLRKALEQNPHNSDLVDKIVSADLTREIIAFLFDGKINRHEQYFRHPVPLSIQDVCNAARVLELITAQRPDALKNWSILSYSYNWLDNPKDAGDELLKHLLSLWKRLAEKGLMGYEEGPLMHLFPLTTFDNPEIVKIAMWIAHYLIKQMGRIDDYIKVEHLVNIMQNCADLTFLWPIIDKGKDDAKMIEKILSALRFFFSKPTENFDLLAKQLKQYHDKVQDFFVKKGKTGFTAQFLRFVLNIEILSYSIAPKKAGPLFRDVANLEAKNVLEETVGLQLLHPNPLEMPSAPPIAILLFGAPGTGKASLAKAVANEAGAILYNVSASVILAKEEKDAVEFIKMLFQMAKNAQPSAVIFIDEIDELLGNGTDIEKIVGIKTENKELLRYATKQRARAEFLVQMDKCCSSSSSSSSSANESHNQVLVISATNQPWELNENVLKRFAKRIYVEMPDKTARAQMLQKIVQENPKAIALQSQITKLANETENYSFDELLGLCLTISLSSGHRGEAKDVHVKPFAREENDKKLENFAKTHHSVNCQVVPTV